jgi:hypothetical protein
VKPVSSSRVIGRSPDLSPCGWALLSDPMEIMPFNDTARHDGGAACWCRPAINEDDVIVHNAADQREDYVERRRKPH